MTPRARSSGAVCLLAASLAACGPPDAHPESAGASDLLVTVRGQVIDAPDTVAAGWSRLRVAEDGGGHIVVLFRLTGNATDADLRAFVAAFDSSAATPAPAVAMGGPEVGDSGEVIVELTPGRYVLACVSRGADEHRHATRGEARLVVVPNEASNDGMTPTRAARGRAPPPATTQEVGMTDFAYTGPDRWPAGAHVLRVRNDGRQDHQLRLARLRPGSTVRDWLNAEGSGGHATDVAGVARLGAGMAAYLPVELPPGEYVAYCLVPDPHSGRAHAELGMIRAIHVE